MSEIVTILVIAVLGMAIGFVAEMLTKKLPIIPYQFKQKTTYALISVGTILAVRGGLLNKLGLK